MTRTTIETTDPSAIYQRMQEAALSGVGSDATLLPAELLAEDVVVETPFAPAGMRRYEGREAWLSYYNARGAGLLICFEELIEVATHLVEDPEVLVVEYGLTGRVIATGVRASAVLRVRDGLITGWREYQDIPAISEALRRSA